MEMEPEENPRPLQADELKACTQLLSEYPLFKSLNSDLLAELANLFMIQTFAAGEFLTNEGDLVTFVGFLAEGEAEVRQEITKGNQRQTLPLACLSKNEALGLSTTGFYSTTGKRTASVVALTNVTFFRLDLHRLNNFMETHSEVRALLQTSSLLMLKMNLIKEAAPFARLSLDTLVWLAGQVTERSMTPGDLVFSQGEEAKECYFISAGQIEILHTETDGSLHPLTTLKAGTIFGETALLIEAPRNATARAKEKCQLLVLNGDALLKVLETEAETQKSMQAFMTMRCRPFHQEGIESYSMKLPDGEEVVTLKNPQSLRYFRLSQEGWFIWQQLNGRKTIRDLTMDLFAQFEILNPNLVSQLIAELNQSGFVILHRGTRKQKKTVVPLWLKPMILIRQVMEARWSFGKVDAWITKSYEGGIKIFYTRTANLLFALIALSGFSEFLLQFHRSIALMQVSHGAGWLFLATIPIVMVVLVTHELAHAYTTKYFGRAVHGFGLGWLWLGPIAFCDTSDMWLCPAWQRVYVDLAGLYWQLIVAGLASLLSLCFTAPPILLFLWYFSLFNYLVVFQNLTPIVQCDGYYALMDLTDTPNLRVEALNWFITSFRQCLRQPKLFLEHKPELCFWLANLVFLLLDFLFSYFVINHLLAGLLGTTNPLFSLALSLLVVFVSGLSLWAELKRQRLETGL